MLPKVQPTIVNHSDGNNDKYIFINVLKDVFMMSEHVADSDQVLVPVILKKYSKHVNCHSQSVTVVMRNNSTFCELLENTSDVIARHSNVPNWLLVQ